MKVGLEGRMLAKINEGCVRECHQRLMKVVWMNEGWFARKEELKAGWIR
jgi:hypothetical protein